MDNHDENRGTSSTVSAGSVAPEEARRHIASNQFLVHGVILFLIVVVAAALRFNGLFWGLPYVFNPDEPHFVVRAMRMVTELDPNPGWFGHPGTLTLYTLTLSYIGYGLFGFLAGWFGSFTDFVAATTRDPPTFYLIGRIVILGSALANLLLLWLVARKVAPGWVALIAVAALAVMPMDVGRSTLVRTDVHHALTMLLVAYFALGIAQQGRIRDYIASGLALGLAVTVKYTAFVAVIGIVAAALLHASATGVRQALPRVTMKLAAAGTASIVTAFLVSPFLFLDYQTALEDIAAETGAYRLGAMSDGVLSTLYFYANTLSSELTLVGLALAGVGIIAMLRSGDRSRWVLVLMALAYLLFLSFLPLRWGRWLLPLLPFFALFAAIGLYTIMQATERLVRQPWPALLALGITMAWLSQPLSASIEFTRWVTLEDTRSVAARWVAENLPKDSKILQERYTPQLRNRDYNVFHVAHARRGGKIRAVRSEAKYIVPRGVIGHLTDIDEIERRGVDYVILGSDYARRKRVPEREASMLPIYEEIFSRFKLIAEFKPSSDRPGPPVFIFKVKG